MKRFVKSIVLGMAFIIIGGPWCLINAQDLAAKANATDRPQNFARADFKAAPGDRATLEGGEDVPVASGMTSYELYWKARRARDDVGIDSLKKDKSVRMASTGTEVLVIKTHDLGKSSDAPPCAEVRVKDVDGPLKDEVVWVERSKIAQMAPFPVRLNQTGILDGSLFPAGFVPIASSRLGYNLFAEAWNTRDFALMDGLAIKGHLVSLKSETPVKVRAICIARQFQRDFGLDIMGVNVEILAGPFKGKTGWVIPDAVVKAR